MCLLPLGHRFYREKDTYCEGRLAIGSDVENEFSSRSLGIVRERGPLSHEVILIDVALGSSIGLQAADRHANIMSGTRVFVVGCLPMVACFAPPIKIPA